MSKKYKFTPVNKIPEKTYIKSSKYDRIINKFLLGRNDIVKIVTTKNSNYVRTQLHKRIRRRELDKQIKVTVVNKELYIEKI